MCDTIVVTRGGRGAGATLFAKNSDREPDEAQLVEVHPALTHAPGSRLRCTYVEVPEVLHTHRVLLSRPYWMWGAEMGANEHGLVIGNEAVFTRAPRQAEGLLGMDLLRLTLERASSAEQGVGILTSLLEEHGQGGPAGHRDKRFVYDNSFLLADPDDAWVLETAGRAWVAARVRGVRAISNGLTLRDRYDRAAGNLAALARDMGADPGRGAVDFSATFSRRLMTAAAGAVPRRACLEGIVGGLPAGVASLLAGLRRHGPEVLPGGVEALRPGLRMSVCAHASWLPTQASQTTASMVSELGATVTHWLTGTSAPCTSVFKPVWLDAGLPELGPAAAERYDEASLWWRHERLHRRALADPAGFQRAFAAGRDALERDLVAKAARLAGAPVAERARLTAEAFAAAEALEGRTLASLPARRPLPGVAHRRRWRRLDERSGVPA